MTAPAVRIYDLESCATIFTRKAAGTVARKYHPHINVDDLHQDLALWVLAEGRERVERWMASRPQQTTACYRALVRQGTRLAERIKAETVGYSVDDVAWYSSKLVESLLPDALNPSYAGSEGVTDTPAGDWMAMVLDVRRVLTDRQKRFFADGEGGGDAWSGEVGNVVARLGGLRPGRRRVMSNAAAQAVTSTNESSGRVAYNLIDGVAA